MNLTTWPRNENLLLKWVGRLSSAIQSSEEELRGSVIAINKELTELKKSKVPMGRTILKIVECTIVTFAIGGGVYQNIIHGLDSKWMVSLVCGSYVWVIGKYNRRVLEERVEKLEQLKYLQPVVVFRRFENLLKSIEGSKIDEIGYQNKKNFWLRALGDIREESFSYPNSSGSDDSSRGDVDSPLPISSGGSD